MYIVRTQPGGRGGQAIVINFITVQGGGGSKKAKNLRTYYVHGPLLHVQFIALFCVSIDFLLLNVTELVVQYKFLVSYYFLRF